LGIKSTTLSQIKLIELWINCHNSVFTYEVLGSGGFILNPICSICGGYLDSILRVLRNYQFRRNF